MPRATCTESPGLAHRDTISDRIRSSARRISSRAWSSRDPGDSCAGDVSIEALSEVGFIVRSWVAEVEARTRPKGSRGPARKPCVFAQGTRRVSARGRFADLEPVEAFRGSGV